MPPKLDSSQNQTFEELEIINPANRNLWFIKHPANPKDIRKYQKYVKQYLANSVEGDKNLNSSLLSSGIKIMSFYNLLDEKNQKDFTEDYEKIQQYISHQLENQRENKYHCVLHNAEEFFEVQKLPQNFLQEFKKKSRANPYNDFATEVMAFTLSFICLMGLAAYYHLTGKFTSLIESGMAYGSIVATTIFYSSKLSSKKEILIAINNENQNLFDEHSQDFVKLKSLKLEKPVTIRFNKEESKSTEEMKIPPVILQPNPAKTLIPAIETKTPERPIRMRIHVPKSDPKKEEVQRKLEERKLQRALEKELIELEKIEKREKTEDHRKENERRKELESQRKLDEEISKKAELKRREVAKQKQEELERLEIERKRQEEFEKLEELRKQIELGIRQNLAFQKWQCATPEISLQCEESIQELHQCLLTNNLFSTFQAIKLKGSFVYQFYLNAYLEEGSTIQPKDVDLEITSTLKNITQDSEQIREITRKLFSEDKDCENFQMWRHGKDSADVENIQITFNNLGFHLPLEVTFRDREYVDPKQDWVCEFDSFRVLMTQDSYNIYSIIGNFSEVVENIKTAQTNEDVLHSINPHNPKIAKKLASYKERGILDSQDIMDFVRVNFIKDNVTKKSPEIIVKELFEANALNCEERGVLILEYYQKLDKERLKAESSKDEEKKEINQISGNFQKPITPKTTASHLSFQKINLKQPSLG